MHITPLGASVIYSDDYVETDNIGVTLTPVLNAGVVELQYTTTWSHENSRLKTSSRTLIGDTAPAFTLTIPGVPTITGVL
jgi:hypothetical protein